MTVSCGMYDVISIATVELYLLYMIIGSVTYAKSQ
jgi:hypothetical protein